MEQSGYLLLADISGYTEFVTQTEIDHGNQVLETLIEIIVEGAKKPFRLQEIEGDAVFCYAPGNEVGRGEIVLELIERQYTAFRRALEQIDRDSTCQCRACASARDLDLKFVLHYGDFASRDVAGHSGISGPAVILVHRLLKNNITEATSCRAYAFLTAPAVDALGIDGVTEDMPSHSESYDHLGAVNGFVYDMAAYWERSRAEREYVITKSEALFEITVTVPGSPLLAWQVYTDPRQRQKWLHTNGIKVEGLRHGRYGPGTLEHCAHGKNTVVQKTLDRKPMRYVTHAAMLPFGVMLPYTAWFEETDNGTRVNAMFGAAVHDNRIVQAIFRFLVSFQARKAEQRLRTNFNTYADMVDELSHS